MRNHEQWVYNQTIHWLNYLDKNANLINFKVYSSVQKVLSSFRKNTPEAYCVAVTHYHNQLYYGRKS